jgi:hypothetical protein
LNRRQKRYRINQEIAWLGGFAATLQSVLLYNR